MTTRLTLTVLSSALAVGAAACADQPADRNSTRRALLVGCTAYPNLTPDHQLHGATTDVHLVRDLLIKKYQFPRENIAELVEGFGEARRPTLEHIRAGFEELARKSRLGDRVVILLSGHGAQQPAQTKDRTEVDRLDEIFLPADVGGWDSKSKTVTNAIIDNDLGEWLRAIQAKGASVWLIVDSCHSGTMIRGTDDDVVRGVRPEELVPKDVLDEAYRAAQEVRRQGRPGIVDDWLEPGTTQRGLVALYACQPHERTVETRPPDAHGLMTYTLCQVLNEARGPLTHAELVRRIHRSYIASGRFNPPMPTVEGPDVGRLVLDDAAPSALDPMTLARDRDGWTIDGGELRGLTPRTVLAVSAPGDSPRPDEVVGHVRILADGLGPLQSRVEPCEYAGRPADDRLPEGGTCRPVYFDYGSMLRLGVAADRYVGIEVSRGGEMPKATLADPVRARLAELLRGIERAPSLPFRLVERPEERADWLVRAADPQAGRLYLLPKTDLMLPRSGSTSDAVPGALGPFAAEPAALEETLRRIARYHQLLRIVGKQGQQDRPGLDDVVVDLELRRLKSPEDEEGTPLEDRNGRPDFREGDVVGFLVTNRGLVPADVTLLFLDSDFYIEPLFPANPSTDNRLIPHQKLLRRARINASTTGEEHVALIAVKAKDDPLPADFTFLVQPRIERAKGQGQSRGIDASRGFDSPLGQLVQNAIYAHGTTRRGLDQMELRNFSMRLVSWRTLRRDAQGP
jgi:hypothetical protein